MKIIIDTNIVFSTLLRTSTTFGQIIFNSDGIFEFYSPRYLTAEIRKHWTKIKKLSKLTDQQLEESYDSLLSKINFVNEVIIPQKFWEDAEKITAGIDPDDTDFVALTKYLRGKLWTSDLELKEGLKRSGFKNVLSTNEILKLWKKKNGDAT